MKLKQYERVIGQKVKEGRNQNRGNSPRELWQSERKKSEREQENEEQTEFDADAVSTSFLWVPVPNVISFFLFSITNYQSK